MIDRPTNSGVQWIAKQVLAELPDVITPNASEATIARYASDRLAELGVTETWYYNCPALVLAGNRTCLSLSGRDYVPEVMEIGSDNVISIDLSPSKDSLWGDCARTYVIERGQVTENPSCSAHSEGLHAQRLLHDEMIRFVEPRTSFHALHEFASRLVESMDFENLDFLGNFGHSIASRREDRVFIERGNREALGAVPCFTFEPHIRRVNGAWGFKHENIYYFSADGSAIEL
jgi:methionine aminopeptidase